MLRHDKKLAAAWRKKDKTSFLALLPKIIMRGIKKDAKEFGWTQRDFDNLVAYAVKKK